MSEDLRDTFKAKMCKPRDSTNVTTSIFNCASSTMSSFFTSTLIFDSSKCLHALSLQVSMHLVMELLGK